MESNVNGGKPKDLASYRVDGSPRTAGTITPNKGGYKIADTATTARVGNVYRAETGTAALIGVELMIIEANTNDFTVASKIAPTASDTFYILRPITPRYDSTGAPQATIDTTGLATSAKQDTQITSLQLLDDAVSTTGSAVPAKGFQATGTDGINARALKTDSNGELQIDVLSSALPSGASTSAIQTDGTQKTQIVDAAGDIADVKVLSSVPVTTDKGLITQSTIYGLNSGGGGTYVDVKVNPAGKLLVTADINQTTPGTTNGVVVTTALPAGTNNIGDVDVLSLPALPAGSNNIGDVDVLSLPALPTGTNIIGRVGIDQTTPGTTNGVAVTNSPTVFAQAVPASGTTSALSRAKTSALDNDIVVKASAGRLYLLVVANTGSVSQYVQIHNAASAPIDGVAPEYCFHLPSNSSVSLDETLIGDYFSTGIYVCNSTTAATKTIGAANCFITALYL